MDFETMELTIAIFILVYLAMATGHLPGFRVDRTGAAVVGAMALIATDRISPAAAWNAIDYRTIGLLFGLLVISAAFLVAGFYDWVAEKIGELKVGPKGLLAIVIGVAGGLAALLNKDVVAVAMSPILCTICLQRRLDPIPFLLGFCFAANFASAATLIGSPQNMILAETLRLSFMQFVRAAALPALLALPLIWIVLVIWYRNRWQIEGSAGAPAAAQAPLAPPVPLDLGETIKATCIATAVIAAFVFTGWPHMLIALAGASCLLISRRYTSTNMLHHVNGDLILLLFGLFVVNAAFTATGLPERWVADLRGAGLDLQAPLPMLLVMAVISNIIGNNPSVMLVVPFIAGTDQPEAMAAAVALGTALSSSAVIFGSLVGIVVAEECRKRNISLTFTEFAKAGVPTAILALLIAGAWIVYISK